MIGLLTSVSRMAVWTGGVLLIGSAFMVSIDVALRNTLGVTLGGADELAGYVLAISTSWAFSYALIRRGNVRIDVLYRHLPRRARALLDVLSLALLLLFVSVLCLRAVPVVWRSLELGSTSLTPLQTPLAIPQTIWLAGLVLFVITALVLTLQALAAFARGRNDSVQDIAGIAQIAAGDSDTDGRLRSGDRRGTTPGEEC